MQCPHCQQDNPSHAKFCLECGTPFKRTGGSGLQEASYGELRSALTEAFEQQTATGQVLGVDASEELRLLVAASAVTLSVAWPDYEWDQLTEVLLYPQAFNRDYGFEDPELAGQAHHWGTVILSVPSLLDAFEDPDDGAHVGIHEFAHLVQIDSGFDQTRFGEIPSGLGPDPSRAWAALVAAEMERVRRGESVLDPYGSENPSEFLAVAVETFFEIPLELRDRHRELYRSWRLLPRKPRLDDARDCEDVVAGAGLALIRCIRTVQRKAGKSRKGT